MNKLIKHDDYYNFSRMLSFNRLWNFIIGTRGAGKTFGFKKYAIQDFLKNKKQFIYMKRYRTDMEDRQQFFDDIVSYFPHIKFEVKGWKAYINDEVAGYFIPLSRQQSKKSTSYPNVNKICFDEFVIDKGGALYLRNEAQAVLELYLTVDRWRDTTKIFFLSNAISIVNPHFMYWDIQPNTEKQFTTFKGELSEILIEWLAVDDFKNRVKQTKIGKMIKNTTYGEYAIDSKFLRDDETFVEKKSESSVYQGRIIYKNNNYGIWWDIDNNIVYINTKYNSNSKAYAITTNDLQPNTMLIKSQMKIGLLRFIKDSFSLGIVRYDSMTTKNQMYEVMGLLSIR